MIHLFTPEQLDFIRKNTTEFSNADLTERFNAHFRIQLSRDQIKSCKKNHHLPSGINGRFPPGHNPINKGVVGWQAGGNSVLGQFKKGMLPFNYRQVGFERVNSERYVDVKIAEPKKWKQKHHIIWEAANGKVPNGYAVIFGDGNRLNFDPTNLILVTRGQLATLNRHGLIGNTAELTRTGLMVAKVLHVAAVKSRTVNA